MAFAEAPEASPVSSDIWTYWKCTNLSPERVDGHVLDGLPIRYRQVSWEMWEAAYVFQDVDIVYDGEVTKVALGAPYGRTPEEAQNNLRQSLINFHDNTPESSLTETVLAMYREVSSFLHKV